MAQEQPQTPVPYNYCSKDFSLRHPDLQTVDLKVVGMDVKTVQVGYLME